MFGGMPTRNTQVTPGGVGEHTTRGWLERSRPRASSFATSVRCATMRPRSSTPNGSRRVRIAIPRSCSRSRTRSIVEGLHDAEFLARYCAGFNRFRDYLLGATTASQKTADWAAGLSEISADRIRGLARKMAASRTFINVNWSLQRGDHGEQPIWAAIALAAMLGQVGLPGGGFGFGYGSMEGLAGLRAGYADADAAARPQSGSQLHPGRSNRRFAAQPGSAVSVQRSGPRLSRHRSRLLVRRQSVSSSSGYQPPDSRVAPPFDDHRPRSLVDRDRAPCGHRAADDHDARARRYRRERARQIHHRDEAGDRAGRRSARRLRQSSATSPIASELASRSPKAAPRFNGCATCTTRRASSANRRVRGVARPSMSSGSRGYFEIPEASKPNVLFEEFRMNPEQQSAADSVGTNRNLLRKDREL